MERSSSLKNNQYHSLPELFSGEHRKVVIPDFQRDYCWGDETHGDDKKKEIVTGFLESLIEEFNNHHRGNEGNFTFLGKIDVYGDEEAAIYLTDGQQRLTTLYLLLGMLYRTDPGLEACRKCLISDFELNHDDQEPYLQYAIRESSLFFLRDLVCQFFLNGDGLTVESIETSDWFFSEYRFDPTISSMLRALKKIEAGIKGLDISAFANFLLTQVKVQYCKIEDRQHGEERFVIINTTGIGLADSENVKPILLGKIGNLKYHWEWEERETWFWKHRLQDESTADEGVNDFLTWYFRIAGTKAEVDIIREAKQLFKGPQSTLEKTLDELGNYLAALKSLIGLLADEEVQQQFKFIKDPRFRLNAAGVKSMLDIRDIRQLSQEEINDVLLPSLAFLRKFGSDKTTYYPFLRRLRKNVFNRKWDDRKNNYLDWRYVLQIIRRAESVESCLRFDVLSLQNTGVELKGDWYGTEEILKDKLRLLQPGKIEEMEDHAELMGDLHPILSIYFVEPGDQEVKPLVAETSIDPGKLCDIFDNFSRVVSLLNKNNWEEAEDQQLSNFYRLFRLYAGINRISHIRRTSGIRGIAFSDWRLRSHLADINFFKLCKHSDLIGYCKRFIEERIRRDNVFGQQKLDTDRLLRQWLTLKVYNAEIQGGLLHYYDGNDTGVAAYVAIEKNRIFKDGEFGSGLENLMCGFAVKSGRGGESYVDYTKEHLWNKPEIIDAPFAGISFKRSNEEAPAAIAVNKAKIDELIDYILKSGVAEIDSGAAVPVTGTAENNSSMQPSHILA